MKPTHPGTAYTIFLNEKNADSKLEQLHYTERIKVIGSLWKQMDMETKELYRNIYARKKEEYDKNYERFLKKLPEFRKNQEVNKFRFNKRGPMGSEAHQEDGDKQVNGNSKSKKAKNGEATPTKAKPKGTRKSKNSISEEDVNSSFDPSTYLEVKMDHPEPVKVTKKRKIIDNAEEKGVSFETKKAKKTKRVTEPEKPPSSVKEYFKTIYEGDAKEAGKVFKRLSNEEKQKHYDDLRAISDKYIADFTAFLKSLTKEVNISVN